MQIILWCIFFNFVIAVTLNVELIDFNLIFSTFRQINGENDSDPFDIKPDDAFTPVGVSFVFMDDLGNKRTKNQCSDLFDEEYKKIGEIETFFEVKEKVQMAKLVLTPFTFNPIIFVTYFQFWNYLSEFHWWAMFYKYFFIVDFNYNLCKVLSVLRQFVLN